jgi:hypothetical protein
MKLPLRDFADVITAMKGPMDALGNSEKRRAARMTVQYKINVFLLEQDKIGQSFSVLTRDISLTGMGVLQSVALRAGSHVVVELPRPGSPLYVVSLVMHSRPLADGVLAVGLEFERVDNQMAENIAKSNTKQEARIRQSVLQ